jgi:hypothetical protein
MKQNRWTIALMGAGLITGPALANAEETPSSVLTAVSSTTLSGYVDTSAQWNFGTGDANVPDYAFGGSSKADGFNLNVVKLSLEKPVDTEAAWGAGYKADLLFGPDANSLATQSVFGNGSQAFQGDFAIKQAYVALRAPLGNGLDVKMGVFDTVLGYEVFESINNPNFTRSYGYTIEPTTHTGVLASYKFADFLSASAGVANTYGPTINGRSFYDTAESYKTYLGSLALTAPESWGFLAGSTLSGAIINGFNSAAVAYGGPANQTSVYVGAVVNTPVKGLKVGASYDYASVDDQSLTSGESSYANATALYASMQLTEKLTFNARGEYASSGTASTFMAEKVYALTGTLQYDLWKNVVSRLEFRWDHADSGKPYGGTVAGEPGNNADSYILMANIAYKF